MHTSFIYIPLDQWVLAQDLLENIIIKEGYIVA